ncbi:MAG: hypothetical protein HZB30_08900 [Nitrospirae bacterium]|nr:hypothetical protein [Nitrospirota bacterium]
MKIRNMCKKITTIIFTLFLLSGITTQVFAQKAEGKTGEKTETKTFTGTVDSISLADPAKGTKSEIIVSDEKNKKLNFLIISTTTMYGAKSVPITLEKIKKGDKVKVKYATTTEGIDKAISVRIVP